MIVHVLFLINVLALIGPIVLLVLAFNTYHAGRTWEWLSNIAATGCALFAVIMGSYFLATWLPYDGSACEGLHTGFGAMARCSAYDAAAQIVEGRWDYFFGSIAAGIFAVALSWCGTKHAEKYGAAREASDA